MNSGSGFVEVQGESTPSLNQVLTINVTSGSSYTFRYKVENIYGWSANYSQSVKILAAVVPTPPLNIITANIAGTTTVNISWSPPTYTGGTGVLITAYKILFKQANGTYSESVANCNGSSSTTISNMYCIVTMSVFTSTPFNLTLG